MKHHNPNAFEILCGALAAGGFLFGFAAHADPPSETTDDIICRAQSGVGFSYWWGGECWCATGADGCDPDYSCGTGSCSGNCPSCTHSGSYGADCSGYVSRVWQVPHAIPVDACHTERYVAESFHSSGPYWNQVSRNSLQPADALASTTHVVLYESGDGWGSMWVYESKGCSYGIVHNIRSCSSSYNAARRININNCECTPGADETDDCGNCGTRTRTCTSDCHWGSWSSCQGEGPCQEGDTETENCCDCGTRTRTCNASCEWSSWSACSGPDPDDGNQVCDTTLSGPCSEGRMRCIEGCLECVPLTEPVAEICDGSDNDCNGQIDNGFPTELGDPPPPYAATLVDYSTPQSMNPDTTTPVWLEFRNDGNETWPAGELWLKAITMDENTPSRLHDPDSWAAWDTAAVSSAAIAPGETTRFAFSIRAPHEGLSIVSTTFRVYGPDDRPLRCPAPELHVQVHVIGLADPDGGTADSTPGATLDNNLTGGCNCTHLFRVTGRINPSETRNASHSALGLYLLALLTLAIAIRFRRRRSSRQQRPSQNHRAHE
jgi:hypothetical protein